MSRRSKYVGTLDDVELKHCWQQYKTTGDRRYREQLILHYQPLVVTVARRVSVNLPAHIDDEDLISYGLFGLMDAIEKFDLSRNIQFATYASTRIHGAIIDELRSIDWVPRSVRAQVRAIVQATQELEGELQRTPTDEEVAEFLDMPMEDLHKVRNHRTTVHVMALDATIDAQNADYSLNDTLLDRTQDPALAYQVDTAKGALARAIATLDTRELVIITLYYYEGLNLSEIGAALGVTESRACQVHSKAMTAIRQALAA